MFLYCVSNKKVSENFVSREALAHFFTPHYLKGYDVNLPVAKTLGNVHVILIDKRTLTHAAR